MCTVLVAPIGAEKVGFLDDAVESVVHFSGDEVMPVPLLSKARAGPASPVRHGTGAEGECKVLVIERGAERYGLVVVAVRDIVATTAGASPRPP